MKKIDGWVIFALILILIALILVFSPQLLPNILSAKELDANSMSMGANYIYAITTPLFSLATIILIGRTYLLQREQLTKTMDMLHKQSFEDTFFKLLENHHRIIEAMDLRSGGSLKQVVASQRDCFKNIYSYMSTMVPADPYRTPENVNTAFDKVQETYKGDLHHYFRFLYHILKYVKTANEIIEEEKTNYTNILRATLSPYELVLIYYNCQHKHGITHFKPLVEEFSFLKNLDVSLLFIPERKELDFHSVAFSSSANRKENLLKWKNKAV